MQFCHMSGFRIVSLFVLFKTRFVIQFRTSVHVCRKRSDDNDRNNNLTTSHVLFVNIRHKKRKSK